MFSFVFVFLQLSFSFWFLDFPFFFFLSFLNHNHTLVLSNFSLCKQRSQKDQLQELQPFDAKRMLTPNRTPVTLKLEGTDLGRGVKWSEDMQGFIKERDIITLEVTVWHVLEFDHYKLPLLSHGQFHDGDTYVVRWQYMISNASMSSLIVLILFCRGWMGSLVRSVFPYHLFILYFLSLFPDSFSHSVISTLY